MAKLELKYGINSDGRLVHVNDVERGQACQCICPDCKAELIAKQGIKKIWHFAHANGVDCKGARMTALHRLAQQIIKDQKSVRLPRYEGMYAPAIESKVITFDDVILEKTIQSEYINRRPDCIGIIGDKQLWIEIKVTHGVDSTKLANIKANRISCVEIDLSSLLNKDYIEKDVHNILFTYVGDDMREWVNNPILDVQDEIKRGEFIQNLKNEIKNAFQTSLSIDQDQQQYPDYIVTIREQLCQITERWMKIGTKESAEWVIYHIYHPYQDRDYVIHIEDFLVPNKDYLSFLVNSPKNQYTLDVFKAILDYDSRTSISLYNVDTTKMITLLNELLKMSNCTEEDMILIEGLRLLQSIY